MSDIIFQVFRNILASEPRVTRFKINWDDTDTMHQSTEDTTYKTEEKVSSDGAVGFSENSSQSVMEVMWKCYKRWCFFTLFLYGICQTLQNAVLFALVELPSMVCSSCYYVIQLSDCHYKWLHFDGHYKVLHAHILET